MQMIERCTINLEPDASAVWIVELYMGSNKYGVYWSSSTLLTLCDVNDWKMY
jgi:hypothetical protein